MRAKPQKYIMFAISTIAIWLLLILLIALDLKNGWWTIGVAGFVFYLYCYYLATRKRM